MIQIKDSSLCCGCTACVSVCPVQCIIMRRDAEGFDYPFPNIDRCIDCGKCEEVCPMQDNDVCLRADTDVPESVRQSYACRTEYEPSSSSGGVFYALAEKVIGTGGVVFGAAFLDGLEVGHIEVEDLAGLYRLSGSKYVQSDLFSSFEDVREYLKSGRKVLFSGTPCQVAGLKSFLDAAYDNLFTVDCACHGVPSPGLWKKYAASFEKFGSPAVKVNFRDKSKGWRDYSVSVELADGRVVSRKKLDDPYMALFLQNVTLRPSCYDCRFRSGHSCADITLGDFWNVGRVIPEMNDGKGVSLLCVNTEKGREMTAGCGFTVTEVPFDEAVAGNSGFQPKVPKPEIREMFFAKLPYASDICKYMQDFVRKEPLTKALLRKSRSFLSKVKRSL